MPMLSKKGSVSERILPLERAIVTISPDLTKAVTSIIYNKLIIN
jgi:hypothetical protein